MNEISMRLGPCVFIGTPADLTQGCSPNEEDLEGLYFAKRPSPPLMFFEGENFVFFNVWREEPAMKALPKHEQPQHHNCRCIPCPELF